jgi:hypothetical protein
MRVRKTEKIAKRKQIAIGNAKEAISKWQLAIGQARNKSKNQNQNLTADDTDDTDRKKAIGK